MSIPLRVLHIAPTPFFSNRGCHIRIRNIITALAERGVHSVLCTYHHGRSVPEIDTRRIFAIPGYRKTGVGFSAFKPIADVPLFFLALGVAWKEKPDVIHGHLHEGALIGWLIKALLFWRRIPLVMDVQGSLSGELEAYGTFRKLPIAVSIFRTAERTVCRLPSFFFCSSEESRAMLIRDFGVPARRVAVTDDGVRPDFFETRSPDELRRTLRLPRDRTLVVYTGSFLEGKGVQHVYDAACRLSERDDICFLLIGYPSEPAIRFAKEHRLAETVRVLGEIDYEDLPRYLGAADLALEPKEPGSGEASGKLIHYMGAGLPVVCFDAPNNRRFLGEHGWFAEPGSSEDFARAIDHATAPTEQAAEQRKMYGDAGRKRAFERFSWRIGGRTMVDVYSRLLDEPPYEAASVTQ